MRPEQNERLTRIGPGTAMGETFRRYWLPFALAEELPAEVPVTDDHWERYEKLFGRGADDLVEGTYWLRRNLANDYLIDRELQRTTSFTGIEGIQTQDYALQEGMGPIVDRSKEILGSSDKAIIAARRLLLEAADVVAAGGTPKGADTSSFRAVRPADTILPSSLPWREGTKDQVTARW